MATSQHSTTISRVDRNSFIQNQFSRLRFPQSVSLSGKADQEKVTALGQLFEIVCGYLRRWITGTVIWFFVRMLWFPLMTA